MKLETLDSLWAHISLPVYNHLKIYLLEKHVELLIESFSSRLSIEVNRYLRKLPSHVAESERDDLLTIAQLEFIETFKSWDCRHFDEVWPLARRRILGAMKDHARFLTRSDPSRLFDWVSDAAYMYQLVEESSSFSQKIDNEMQLKSLMDELSLREKRVVISYTKDGLTFKDIGISLGVSESQISRIYKQAIMKMRKSVHSHR